MILLLLAAAAEQRKAGDAALLDKLGPPIGGGRWRCAPPCLAKRCPHVTAEAVRLLGFIAVVATKQPRQALTLSRVAVESTAAGTVRHFKRSTVATSGSNLGRKNTGLGPFLHNRSGDGEGFADSHRRIGLFKAESRRRKSCVHARPNMGEIDGAAAEQAFATALSLAVAGEAVIAARRTLFLQISRRWRTVDSAAAL